MARDPLATLIKVRKLACDEAQRKLVEALALEDRAEQMSHRVERTIAQETQAATDVNGTDAMVEAFAAWLPSARQQLATARQALLDRQAETMRSRAELTACRTALETVETLQKERKDAAQRAIDLVYARDLEDRPIESEWNDVNAPD
jgi:putative NADH-flavin reductase